MTEDEQLKFKQELLNSAASKLSEHFGSVQIHASFVCNNGQTKGFHAGSGDWYARCQLSREFVEIDQSVTQAREIGKEIQPPDEGESWKKP